MAMTPKRLANYLGITIDYAKQLINEAAELAPRLDTTSEHILAARGQLPVEEKTFEKLLDAWYRRKPQDGASLAIYRKLIEVATTEQLIKLANDNSTAFSPGSIGFQELIRRLDSESHL